ncbi:MAG: OmpA family protein [Chitinophagales bacterium]|nr:OmpA family protein [Chitinophagales bacterium]
MPLLLLILFLLSPVLSFSQSLLANGGFEDVNTCTEYKVECAPEAWISSSNGFSNYFKDPRRAHSGKNCMVIEAGHFIKEYNRTFIRSRLLCGLRKGNKYQLSFFIKSPHDVFDSTGILFTYRDPLFDKTPVKSLTPTYYLRSFLQPRKQLDSSWQKVDLVFKATGEERFIVFAYFAKEDFTDERIHPLENRFFIFLDDISLVPVNPNETICHDWERVKEDIYAENERHRYLEIKIKQFKANPPPPPPVTINTSYVKVDTLVLPDILFDFSKATLTPRSHKILDSFCMKIQRSQPDSIIIEGHTDNVGSFEMNEQLSIDRAFAAKLYIMKKTGYYNIIAKGYSFLRPVADNKTAEGRQQNRRVEVLLFMRE